MKNTNQLIGCCGLDCETCDARIATILAFARENGFEQLDLEVRSSNARAIHLYEKYGFRKLCTFPNFFKINGEHIDFNLMILELGKEEGNGRSQA